MSTISQLWPVPNLAPVTDADLTTRLFQSREPQPKPLLRMNFVSSIDGSAGRPGDSGALSGEADKRVFEILRRVSDVVIVGAGTIRAEGYGALRVSEESTQWRESHGLPAHPAFAIVSGRADLDPGHRIFTQAARRPIVITLDSAPQSNRQHLAEVADVIVCGESDLDPHLMIAGLADRHLTQLLCEGGPHLFGRLLSDRVVDEMFLTISPVLVGSNGIGQIVAGSPTTPRQDMELVAVLESNSSLLLQYRRQAHASSSED